MKRLILLLLATLALPTTVNPSLRSLEVADNWDNIPEGRISYRLITNKKEKMKLRNNLCKNIGVNQDVILPSDLLQYKEKGIKK